MMANDTKKKTMVCKINPKDVGHPLPSETPPSNELVNRNVTGLATKKKMSAEYKENLALRPTESAIFTNKTRKEGMWVIYRECHTAFVNLDRYTVALVEDDDIVDYQRYLAGEQGRTYELQAASPYLQQFVAVGDIHYFAKHMAPWIKTL